MTNEKDSGASRPAPAPQMPLDGSYACERCGTPYTERNALHQTECLSKWVPGASLSPETPATPNTLQMAGDVLSGTRSIESVLAELAEPARETQAPPTPFHRSASCDGERCTLCGAPADLKVGEEIMSDDPNPNRHNLTAYICASCGQKLLRGEPSGTTPRTPEPKAIGPLLAPEAYEIVPHEPRGGQHAGVRRDVTVRHKDTGITVCVGHRSSQWSNKNAAVRALSAAVAELFPEEPS